LQLQIGLIQSYRERLCLRGIGSTWWRNKMLHFIYTSRTSAISFASFPPEKVKPYPL
jgi:hypothetical protein